MSIAHEHRTSIYDRYRKTLLSHDEVKAFSALRILPPVRDAAFSWLGIIAAWGAVHHWHSALAVTLAIPAIGSRYYSLFIIGHDGLHRRVFRNRRANDLFTDLVVFAAIGGITRINNKNHIRHHERLATEGDPDRYKYSCLTKASLSALLGYVSGLGSVFKSIRNVFFGAARPTNVQGDAGGRYSLRDIAILLAVQSCLVGGLTWTFGWWAYPVLWLMPVYVFTFLMDNLRTFLEHSHPEGDAQGDRHRLITYTSNPLERLFIAPMNMNYHAAHHLWPSIPYYQLPAADRAIRSRAASSGLEWRGSYLAFLLRYARALPIADCQPTRSHN
ncbi:MAG TPA: fatty acid desaturase [Polyangiaceae bacterium]|jgi:fatty acid desaturase